MHRIVRTVRMFATASLLAGVGTLAAGCSSSDATSPEQQPQFPGTYALRTVNGQALPIQYQSSGATVQLNSQVITFSGDGTYALAAETQTGQDAPTTYRATGKWNLSGSTVTATDDSDGSTLTGTFSGGNTITQVNRAGNTLIYTK